jgi:hypothetical protein
MDLRVAVMAALLASSSAAWANGNDSHIWITRQALAQLPDGTLKRLLSSPTHERALLNGTIFPDGGYVVGDDYGEMAHWEPFVEAYASWIRARYAPPFEGEAAVHVAFLMGIASHVLADQTYDSMFMAKARGYDAAMWSDETLLDFDSNTDVLLAADTGQRIAIGDPGLEPWYPPEIPSIYQDQLGYSVEKDKIDQAQLTLVFVVVNYAQSAADQPDKVAAAKARYPWSAAHLMDGVTACGPPCEAAHVAAYWRALWDRLHREQRPESFVVATVPRAGGAGLALDNNLVEASIFVTLGGGVDKRSIAPGAIRVTDAETGAEYPIDINPWRDEANVIRLRPRAPWPANVRLTVTLAAGLRTLDGATLDAPFSFEVSTAAGEPGWSDPTPRTGEPVTALPPGCSMVSASRAGAAVVGLTFVALLLAFVRRRRASRV